MSEKKVRQEDSDSEMSNPEAQKAGSVEYWSGYYSLSLQDPIDRPFPHGWRIGQGSSKVFNEANRSGDRGVDLLPIRPGKQAFGIAAVHARVQIHPRSGAFRRANQYCIESVTGQIGNLQYVLSFQDFTQEQYSDFVARRIHVVTDLGLTIPHPKLSAVWRPQDLKRGSVVTHGALSSGAFGWVSAAVNVQDGEPLAIREHRIRT
ncbi:MAG: hypothetical protein Q9181_002097, partial [Wetmoreana brouardii]